MARFQYYNLNPRGIKEDDCVTRAMALALKEDYHYIGYLLYKNAENNYCDRLTKKCYRQLLERKFGLQPRYGKGQSVGDVADMYPNSTIIARIAGHVTCIKNNCVYDLWDCRSDICDEYWVVYN